MRPNQKLSGVLLTLICCSLWGCQSEGGSGLSKNQEQMAANVDSWAKSSGGDWSKLTADQRNEMVQSVGSEQSAKKVLEMKAHPPLPIAPGPPPGWKPGSPPPGH
jgi:hypothetical protein